MKRLITSIAVILVLLSVVEASGSVPGLISYQGVVRDSNGVVVPDDDYDITFRIYDVETGGTALWTESQTVTVSGGILSTVLGTQTTLSLDFDSQYWLGVELEAEGEMAPRMLLTSSPYAMRAAVADSVAGTGSGPGDITGVTAGAGLGGGGLSGDVTLFIVAVPGSGLAVDPVEGISIEPEGVTTDKLAAESVTNEKLSADAVASSNIMDDAVTNAKLSADAVASANIVSNAVTNDKLAADAVYTTNLLNSAVTKAKLADLSVDAAKIESDAVTSTKIQNGSIEFGDIGQNSATTGQVMKWNGSAWAAADDIQGYGTIAGVYGTGGLEGGGASGTVYLNIADDSVTTARLGDGSVTTAKLAADAVTTAEILDGTIGFGDIGQNSAAAGQVMKWNGSAWAAADDAQGTGTITGVYGTGGLEGSGTSGDVYISIADDSVTTARLGDGSVTTAKLAADAVTTAEILDGTIGFEDIGENGATSGQVMKWNGSAWEAAEDNDSAGGGGGWVDDGIVVRLESAADSVGIGTSSPQAKLHVTGNVIGEGSAMFGSGNSVGTYSFAAGTDNDASGERSAVGGGRNNTASGGYSVVSGGGGPYPSDENIAYGDFSVISGGKENRAGRTMDPPENHECAVVGGGRGNRAQGMYATIGGGYDNRTDNDYATVGGGRDNYAEGYCVVGGGMGNDARNFSTIGGGDNNRADNQGTIAGGSQNIATGHNSAVTGGRENSATGESSAAMGTLAKAHHAGSIVLAANNAVSSDDSVYTDQAEQVVIRADGGIYLTDSGGQAQSQAGRFINTSTGGYLSSSGNWVDMSDREMKENFTEIDGAEMLEKIASLPVAEWNYKADDDGIRHIGPVAQDFYRVFGVGLDDRSIATLDEAGISLAAIKELYSRARRQESEIEGLKTQVEQLRALVEKLTREMD